MPRKIAETNEQLGLPHVHVGFDGEIVAVTFMWTMGWYRFHVDLESGDVAHGRPRLRGARRPAAQRRRARRRHGAAGAGADQSRRGAARAGRARRSAAQDARPRGERGAAGPAAEPETPREAAQKPPEILSKSLLGQRSDDETASWEKTKARDFDWDR